LGYVVVEGWLDLSTLLAPFPVRVRRAAPVATAAAVKPVTAEQVVMVVKVARQVRSPEKERAALPPVA
jgi:hypothetical protein